MGDMISPRPSGTDGRFAAVLTLIGTLAGYAAGYGTHLLDYNLNRNAANEHQVEIFTNTLDSDGQQLVRTRDPQQRLAYFGALFSLAGAGSNESERMQEKSAVMSLASLESDGRVQLGMAVIYRDDRDAQRILSRMPRVETKLADAAYAKERPPKSQQAVDKPLNKNLIPELTFTPDPGASSWMYLGKSTLVHGKMSSLFEAYVSPLRPPSGGSTLTVTGSVNLRDSAPQFAPHRLGSIVGIVKPGTSIAVCGTPVKIPMAAENGPNVVAVWARVSLLGPGSCHAG